LAGSRSSTTRPAGLNLWDCHNCGSGETKSDNTLCAAAVSIESAKAVRLMSQGICDLFSR
jgi:hypothetical protein